MSLARRFLSLPQELEGASLPPQVAGKRCGAVLLCVGHILESAVSSRPLPSASLVRVRWWGEQQPSSLFRPSLLSAAHVADEAQRAIAMKYPVVVPPEQLVAYFSDMKDLTLDVIDRGSRRKFGECKLQLDVENDNSVLTAEEKLVALRREDVLCEIKPSGDGQEHEVLGYLAVSFDVQWGDFQSQENEDFDGDFSVSLPLEREWTDFEDSSPLDVESELLSTGVEVLVGSKGKEVDEVGGSRGSSDDSQRIQRLLNKGKALKQSMERAVKEKGSGEAQEEETGENIYEGPVMKQVRDALLLASGEEFTTSISCEKRQIVSLDSKPQLYSPAPIVLDKHSTGTKDQNNPTARVNADLNFSELNEVNALSLAFESLELERSFVENQLRQLRDSSSVSSRFSPIQICVSHSDVASLLHQNSGRAPLPQVHAFSVTTSLRKRQWHLECSSTMLLTRSSSAVDDISSNEVLPNPSKRNATKWLKFHVRCENQSDAQRKKRRHEQHLYPRASKFYNLEGSVDASILFSVTKEAEKMWATTIELFVVEGDNQRDGTKLNSNTREGSRKHNVSRNKKGLAVGRLRVQFSFYDASLSSQSSESVIAENEEESGSPLSSITASSDILQGYQNRRLILPEHALSETTGREAHSKSQYDLEVINSRLRGSEMLQFGVMFEDITNVKVLESGGEYSQSTIEESSSSNIAAEEGRCGDGGKKLDGASISLHYAIPSQFTTLSPPSIKFERTVRRKLKSSHWLDSASLLQAEFSEHIHVFQSLLAEDASKYFSSGQLIIEVWLHVSKDTDRTLLGLSKLHLGKFTEFLRREGSDLHGFSAQSLPFVGVDGRFPIDNPFNGNHAGHLRARVCIGTAEQLLTFATTIRSCVKFQGVVRGVLYRKRFGRFSALNPLSRDSQSRTHDFDSCTAIPVLNEDSRSDGQSTAPTFNIAAISSGLSVDLDDGCTELDAECAAADLKSGAAEQNNCESNLLLHKIRFDIRECWRAVLQREELSREYENAPHGWRDTPLLGCELQGQIVLIAGKGLPNELKGMPFALWWDAADTKLNSCFVHAFQKRGVCLDEARADLPLVGPQSQVLFALHVENGFFGTQSRQTISGEARLNLNAALGGREAYCEGAKQSIRVDDRWIVLDVPIKWDRENSEGQMLPCVLPLKISYQISPAWLVSRKLRNDAEMMASGIEFSDDSSFVEPRCGSVATTSSGKQLQPASIAISFRLLALANIEYLLTGNGHQKWSNDSEATSTVPHLNEVLRENTDCHSVLLEVTLCLGSELHEREGTLLEHEKGVQDLGAHVFEVGGKWYKRWRSSQFPVRMSESMTNFDKLSSQLAMQAHIVLTPEVVTNLQEACANVMVLLWCNACNEPHEIGSSEVPMASILYRAQGVRGMFPIRVGTDLSGARVGVHCFIDHSLLDSSFFKPITLASFGTDELELSPLTEDDASLNENMHDNDLEDVDDLHRPCDGGLEVKSVDYEDSELPCTVLADEPDHCLVVEDVEASRQASEKSRLVLTPAEFEIGESNHTSTSSEAVGVEQEHRLVCNVAEVASSCGNDQATCKDMELTTELENLDLGSDEEDIKPVDRAGSAARPESTSIDDQVESESDALSLSSPRESYNEVDLISILDSSKESEDEGSFSASDVDDIQSFHDEPLSTPTSPSFASKSNEEKAVSSTTGSPSVNIVLDVNKLELKEASNDAASGACASNLKPELAVDKDANERQLERDVNCSDKKIVQYADKAVQVNLLELESPDTTPSPTQNRRRIDSKIDSDGNAGHSDAKVIALSCEKNSTADVGCDAMDSADMSFSSEDNCQLEREAFEASTEIDPEVKKKVDKGISEATTTGKVDITGSSYGQTAARSPFSNAEHTNLKQNCGQGIIQCQYHAYATPSELKSEKLELVYEMLREMRDSYFAKLSSDPVRDAGYREVSTKENKEVASKEVRDTRCRCSSPNRSKESAPPAPRDLTLTVVKGPSSPLARNSTSDGRITRAPPGDKFHEGYVDKTENFPTELYLVERQMQGKGAQLDDAKSATIRCRCSSPNRSKESTPPAPRDLTLTVVKGPSSPLARNSTSDGRITRAPPGDKFHEGYVDKTENFPTELYLVERQMQGKGAQHDDMKPGNILRGSLKSTGERKFQARRMSSTDVWITKPHNDLYSRRQVVKKEEDHSSVRSLFAHDSETERIARIMQGSMNYWMKEDSSSSCDDEISDDEDTIDDDCYF